MLRYNSHLRSGIAYTCTGIDMAIQLWPRDEANTWRWWRRRGIPIFPPIRICYWGSLLDRDTHERHHCMATLIFAIQLLNPFTIRAAKRGLLIWEIRTYKSIYFLKNRSRSVDLKPNNNSPSNILWTFSWFPSDFKKYESSRRYLLEKVWVLMG